MVMDYKMENLKEGKDIFGDEPALNIEELREREKKQLVNKIK